MRRPAWRDQDRFTQLRIILRRPPSYGHRIASGLAVIRRYFSVRGTRARVERLIRLGYVEEPPSHWQLLLAGHHQMLGTASEETKLFYRAQGIPFTFHNLRRFLAEPSTMMDAVGLFSDRDSIIHHIFQTFHRHPLYDFQLLRMFEDGPEELARQATALVDGTHPLQHLFDNLIEDPDYHPRLLTQVREFVENPDIPPLPIVYDHDDDPYLWMAMEQFATLGGYLRYAGRIEATPGDVLRALLGEIWKATLGRLFPGPRFRIDERYCDREIVDKYLPRQSKDTTSSTPSPT
ncbi:MAG: hypothetical protein KC416_08695 [Myxococcales bacterium]|nr:hypothetical protein [Myxococcales bacterium]